MGTEQHGPPERSPKEDVLLMTAEEVQAAEDHVGPVLHGHH